MIIGNTNNNNNSNFNQKLNTIKENYNKNAAAINMQDTTKNMKYTDVVSKNEMQEKAFAMLQDRLSNGTISPDEFNKQCLALRQSKNNKKRTIL